jgi:hypothetical protein
MTINAIGVCFMTYAQKESFYTLKCSTSSFKLPASLLSSFVEDALCSAVAELD